MNLYLIAIRLYADRPSAKFNSEPQRRHFVRVHAHLRTRIKGEEEEGELMEEKKEQEEWPIGDDSCPITLLKFMRSFVALELYKLPETRKLLRQRTMK